MRPSLGAAVFAGMIGVTLFGLLFTPAFYVLTRRAALFFRRLPDTTPAGLLVFVVRFDGRSRAIGPHRAEAEVFYRLASLTISPPSFPGRPSTGRVRLARSSWPDARTRAERRRRSRPYPSRWSAARAAARGHRRMGAPTADRRSCSWRREGRWPPRRFARPTGRRCPALQPARRPAAA